MKDRLRGSAFRFFAIAAGSIGLAACSTRPIEPRITPTLTPSPTPTIEPTPTLMPIDVERIVSEVPNTSIILGHFKDSLSFDDPREDRQILGWQTIEENLMLQKIYPQHSNKYGYFLQTQSQFAFVLADPNKLTKMYIQYEPYTPFYVQFNISPKGDKIVINLLDILEKDEGRGLYILDSGGQVLKHLKVDARDPEFSENGMLIYSSTGPAFSSEIVEVSTGKVTVIDWGLPGCPYKNDEVLCFNTWSADQYRKSEGDILSPNFKYIATQIFTYNANPVWPQYSNEELLFTMIRTKEFTYILIPNTKTVTGLSDDGTINYLDGTTDNVTNYKELYIKIW